MGLRRRDQLGPGGGSQIAYFTPGSHRENGCIESFDARLRDELDVDYRSGACHFSVEINTFRRFCKKRTHSLTFAEFFSCSG